MLAMQYIHERVRHSFLSSLPVFPLCCPLNFTCRSCSCASSSKWTWTILRSGWLPPTTSAGLRSDGAFVLYRTVYRAVYRIVYRTTNLYLTTPCPTIPYHAMPYHTIPYHTIPYQTVHTVPCHTTPYHATPYHTIPHHNTISCHVPDTWS